jgi:hypothetical protein
MIFRDTRVTEGFELPPELPRSGLRAYRCNAETASTPKVTSRALCCRAEWQIRATCGLQLVGTAARNPRWTYLFFICLALTKLDCIGLKAGR